MSDLKEKIYNNEIVLGTMLSEVYTPNIVRVIRSGGFEYIIIDSEHGYFDYSQIASIISVCNGFKIPILVRVPNGERESITKVLDMGADGLLIPMVNSSEDAKKVVQYSKYTPIGRRGISTTRAHTDYNPSKLTEYMEYANKKTLILVQIETIQALENAESIISVNGIDALIVGPNDLAADMNKQGEFDTEAMNNAIKNIASVARRARKFSGIVSSSIDYLHYCRDNGMTIFCCNSEVGMIKKASRQIVKDFYEK